MFKNLQNAGSVDTISTFWKMKMSYWCYQMNFLASANRVSGRLGVARTQTYPPPYVPLTAFTFDRRCAIVFENVEITRAFPNWVRSTWGQWRSFHSVSLHCATCDHKCPQLTFSLHTKARSHCQHSSPGPKEQLGDPSLWLSRLILSESSPSCRLETWQPGGNFLKHPLRFSFCCCCCNE